MIEIRNKSAYFYRSKRVGGRVVRQYQGGGAGLAGDLARAFQRELRLDQVERLEREIAEAEELERLAAEIAERDRAIGEAASTAIGEAKTFLEGLGYRRHARGPWRRRRGSMLDLAIPEPVMALGKPRPTPKRLGYIASEVSKGAARLVDTPDGDGCEPDPNNPGMTKAESVVVDHVTRHALYLAGATTTPAEWSLIQVAATCWWELRHAEMAANSGRKAKHSLRQQEMQDRRVDRLRRRYASLLKTLADLRRLAGPVFVNVQQMNVARGPQQVVNEASN